MKKYLIIGGLILLFLWTAAYVTADEEMTMDPILKASLNKQYHTEITKAFAKSVETLDVSQLNLTSTAGLEYFTNLKELDISNNLLTDSAFLQNMKQLEKLDISNNQLEALKPTSKHLKKLNAKNNRLTTIDFIRPLSQLSVLNIRSNNVVDISPLEDLSQLKKLNIRGNKVRELGVLSGLDKLVNLNAQNNQIRSIEPIVSLPLTERLFLSGNHIKDLSLLEKKLSEIGETDIDLDISEPTFNMDSGVYKDSFQLEMTTVEGQEIYYTLDGSLPNAQSEKYKGPIEISQEIMHSLPVIANHQTSNDTTPSEFSAKDVKKAITVTAVSSFKAADSVARGFSAPVTATYILDDTLFDSQLPVISLRMDPHDLFDDHDGIYVPGIWYEEDSYWSGNYNQRGREYEKPGVIEFFNKEGEPDFNQHIGVRINGRTSRQLPQKSLRLYARSDYGQSRFFTDTFEGLPYNEFNRLLLRNAGQDYDGTLMRDGLMHELVKNTGVDVQAYQPFIVLINGEYWGIENLREKFNRDFIDVKYNVSNDDLVLMKAFQEDEHIDFSMKSGTKKDKQTYQDLITYVEEHDLSDDQAVDYVKERVDIDNLFHYVAFQVYYANTDSFFNNLMIWKKRTIYTPDAPVGHDGRWRWMLFDLDWGMGKNIQKKFEHDGKIVTYDMIAHVLADDEEMALFSNLMDNQQMQHRFVHIMMELLNDNFETEHVKQKIDELAAIIRPEIAQSINRWNNIPSVEMWEDNVDELRDFAERRPDVVKQHLVEHFDITEEMLEEL